MERIWLGGDAGGPCSATGENTDGSGDQRHHADEDERGQQADAERDGSLDAHRPGRGP